METSHTGTTGQTSTAHTTGTTTRRRFGLVAAASIVGCVAVVGSALPASAARVRPQPVVLATPTVIVANNITARSFSLNIGGSTVKTYNVFVNGSIASYATPSSSSVPIAITGLASNTAYSVTVQETLAPTFQTSPLSTPRTVRTLVSTVALPVSNLRLVSAVPKVITVAWDKQVGTALVYDIFLNGIWVTSTTLNSAEIRGKYGYPNIIAGTEPKPGNNIVGIRTRSDAAASLGETSAIVEISVFVPSA